MQKSAVKTASLPIFKSAARTVSLPMQKSAAKTESSIHIYIYFIFFLLGVYKPSHMGQAEPSPQKKQKKCFVFMHTTNILKIF
jgi:small neutral amino acid transporter SnatA (MarC family)